MATSVTHKLPANTAVIGRIPGYNELIDSTGEFQQELLKGLTFIDLRPMTYVFGEGFTNGVGGAFDDLKLALTKAGLFTRDSEKSKTIFQGVLERMQDDFELSDGFKNCEMIRIIGANDSTFTETFSNSYDAPNGVLGAFQASLNKANESAAGGMFSLFQKGMKSYDHASLIDLAGTAAQATSGVVGDKNAIADIATGALFGMDMAVPSMWQQSNYSSTLTLFVKLVAPVGSPECIRKNILEPILVLLAASSPVTYSGIMYGFPLLWDIQARGITDFRVGGIAAMSLIRGSFETTFNHLLQPTVIDVRLTLVPILNDFAVQTGGTMNTSDSIYTAPDELGVQNPSDIVRGVTNAQVAGSTSVVTIDETDIRTIRL